MTYVLSDIHGEFKKYTQMLEKIDLKEDDTLFVLGDVIDRGPEPLRVLLNMYMRKNVRPVMGNHELMAMRALDACPIDDEEEEAQRGFRGREGYYMDFWHRNGGFVTYRDLVEAPRERCRTLIRYMESFAPYAEYENRQGHRFVMVHAGFSGYRKERPLADYTVRELAFDRPSFKRQYFDENTTVIVGHTPTITITGRPEIFTSGNMKFIDCGATFGGSLACLCLDTMEEFYV